MNQPATTPLVDLESTAVLPPVSAAPEPSAPTHSQRQRPGQRLLKALQSVGFLLLVAAILVIFLGFVLGVRLPGMAAAEADVKIEPPRRHGVELVKDQPHTLQVSEQVCAALGIRKGGNEQIEAVKLPTATRPLTLYGSTALNPATEVRVRARFVPCEVVQIGKHPLYPGEPGNDSEQTQYRELLPGDRVHKGDILGVFFSVDVGCKKNDLLDALVQYELDQKIWDNMQKSQVMPELAMDSQWSKVQQDRNAIGRALNTLIVWNIPQEDIDALHEEAKKISSDKKAWFKTRAGRWVKREKQAATGYDPDKENDNTWGRVTMRAPFDGVIVERNVTVHDTIQDPTTNLFRIAQVDRLLVTAYAPEDELPTLNALKREQRVWSVQTVGVSSVRGLKGHIEEIGYLIDPNQHTAVIKGYIDNPKEMIRGGQFVSCTVQIPPPQDVVEVPMDAVVEDGKYAVVFVQPDPAKNCYTMRRVQLTHRFEKTAFVRSKPFRSNERLTAEEKEMGMLPLEPLRTGERILRTGVGELKAALLDLESRQSKEKQASESKLSRHEAT